VHVTLEETEASTDESVLPPEMDNDEVSLNSEDG